MASYAHTSKILDTVKPAGHRFRFHEQLITITNNPVNSLLSWITVYEIIILSLVLKKIVSAEPKYFYSVLVIFRQSIVDLIAMRPIYLCQSCENQYISSFYHILQPNGKQRFICLYLI